ncbi:hypothetical protein [Mycobacterium sp.]|uniref:hypothetical protein n=1 Tax=Mycobacterium sp. TaxID=1785 RepID=UPI003D11DB6D
MGDTSRDPIDHEWTSRPRVGQALKSGAKIPGLLFVTAGLTAFAIGLTCFARHQANFGVAAIVFALLAATIGAVWLIREARRVRGLEDNATPAELGPA